MWEDKGFRIITKGVFGDGFLDISMRATRDPRINDAEYGIVDFRDVTEFPIDSGTIEQIAKSDAMAYKLNPNMKLAVIANGMVMRSLTHMYQVYFELNNDGDRWDAEMFETEAQARDWINNEN